MPELTLGQYELVYNMLSLSIAAMLASFVFFILGRGQVAPVYRISLIVSALVVGIAGYHYIRIFQSWEAAYVLNAAGDAYIASGKPFNDAYRYVDWLLTVPLLMVELVLVLRLAPRVAGPLMVKLVIAAVLMIALGYPGEIIRGESSMFSERGLWGLLSTLPFVYILYVLWVELGESIKRQPPKAAVLIRNIRLLTLATWGFYPIAYMAPFFGLAGGMAEVSLQVGYSIADIAAKCGYGVMIYAIARAKTEADGEFVLSAKKADEDAGAAVPAPATKSQEAASA
ncbi:MAG: bacteriorhodopsin-like [Opitutales bacterium]